MALPSERCLYCGSMAQSEEMEMSKSAERSRSSSKIGEGCPYNVIHHTWDCLQHDSRAHSGSRQCNACELHGCSRVRIAYRADLRFRLDGGVETLFTLAGQHDTQCGNS